MYSHICDIIQTGNTSLSEGFESLASPLKAIQEYMNVSQKGIEFVYKDGVIYTNLPGAN